MRRVQKKRGLVLGAGVRGGAVEECGPRRDTAPSADLFDALDAVLWEGEVKIVAGDVPVARLTYVSGVAERLLGEPPQYWLSSPDAWSERVHPDDRVRVDAAWREVAASGRASTWDYRGATGGGTSLWLRDRVCCTPNGRDGVRYLCGITADITGEKQREDALREMGEYYRALVEDINEIVFSVDHQGRITYVNPNMERSSGYTADEVLGRHFSQFVHLPDLLHLGKSFRQTLAGAYSPAEYRLVGKRGEIRWVRSSGKPILKEGEVVGVRGVLMDITERKQIEVELKKNEERYRDLFENAQDWIYVHDLEGKFTAVNKSVERITGYTREQALGMHFVDLAAPGQAGLVRDIIEETSGGCVPTTWNLEILSKGGRRIPIEVSTRLITEEGEPRSVQGIARDLRERCATPGLTEPGGPTAQEPHVSVALGRVGREMIGTYDADAIFKRACRLTAQFLHCDCSHTFLWRWEEDAYVPVAAYSDAPESMGIIHGIKVPRTMIAFLLKRLEQEDVVQIAARPKDLVPEALPLQLGFTVGLFSALRRGKELIGMQSACYRTRREPFAPWQEGLARGIAQITSLAIENARLNEGLNNANRLKSDFVATMSHELRTPLNAIIGYSSLLGEGAFGNLTEEQMEPLGRVEGKARDLLNLIDGTLDLSRLESGLVRPERKRAEIGALLSEIAEETDTRRDNSRVRFEWEVAPEISGFFTDPVKLKVILRNLVHNALKFTEEGSVRVTAHPRGAGVEFVVADTGVGMTAEAQTRVFEPFRQADSSISDRYGGTGLGLYIVRRLLQLLGGTIRLQSEAGHGSTFRVWLPSVEG